MSHEPDLFTRARRGEAAPATASARRSAPLAERMRPATLDEFVGQAHLLGPGRVLGEMLGGGYAHSLVLWGPPGSGKTTLARLVAKRLDLPFAALSAVNAGVKDVRAVVERAEHDLAMNGRPTVLFLDEIHRFNKAQQDALLPHVEKGTLVLVGATTENPSFEVISPLLSRMRVLTLEPLTDADIGALLDRARADPERGLGKRGLELSSEAREALVAHAQGDARVALGALEVSAELVAQSRAKRIEADHVVEAAQKRSLRYDRAGDEHYNVISAFIKSLRGSDPDAAMYWLARMLEAGEDPLFIARRMVIFAAEDIGNADPRALQVALSVKDAVHFVGLPEGRIPLAQGVTFLATAPKSNASLLAIGSAVDEVRRSGTLPVPLHLRNAPTPLMKAEGYGRDYRYPHDHAGHHVEEEYLPEPVRGRRFYEPSDQGEEGEIRERLERWRRRS
ncbi:MAG: replication-associated recombination protein A [Deltaproteobacteria bacterium]|nr:replication-associated recombination protein A [Deltaproteobacteria bacterium]